MITNEANWSSPYVLAIIKGDARKFAEQSVADYPAPTKAEIAEADAGVGKRLPKDLPFTGKLPRGIMVVTLATTLLIYVGFPALVAALLFRGGLVLLVAGVTYVRRDGARASRLRLLWRAMVTWGPVVRAVHCGDVRVRQALDVATLAGPGVARSAGRGVGRLAGARPARPSGRHVAGAALSSLWAQDSILRCRLGVTIYD